MRLVAAILALGAAGAATAAETIAYTYDARGRLVKVVRSGGPANGTQVEYTLDPASNRVKKKVTGAPS